MTCIQVKAASGLKQPSLLWSGSASAALQSSERQLRDVLSEAVLELATRGAALNEARCDRMLAATLSSGDYAGVQEASPAAVPAANFPQEGPAAAHRNSYGGVPDRRGPTTMMTADWMPSPDGGTGYRPPPVTSGASQPSSNTSGSRAASYLLQQQQQQRQLQRPPVPGGGGGGPSIGANVLGSLGQRVSEAVTTHWTGLGSAFGGGGGGGLIGGAAAAASRMDASAEQQSRGAPAGPGSGMAPWTGGRQADRR